MTNIAVWFLTFIQFLLLIVSILLVVFMVYTIYALYSGAPFLPTSNTEVEKMIELMNLQKGEKLIDLGSGDGRILFKTTETIKDIEAVGIEINPVVYWWSKIKNKIKGNESIEIYRKNLWNIDLSDADIVAIFFIGDKMERLKNKIKTEMKPGSKIVSHSFKFPDWKPKKSIGDNYLYIV